MQDSLRRHETQSIWMDNVYLSFFKRSTLQELFAEEVFLFPLLQECSHAFLLVMCCEGQTEHIRLKLQACIEVNIKADIDALLSQSNTVRGALHEVAGKLLSLCHELILRIDMVYKADAHSFLCTDHDVSAEDELFRDLLVGQAGKSLCAAEAGDDAQASFRLTELGIVGSQSNVASHGDLAAAAQSEAVDCSDGGLFHILKALESNACKETESTAFGSSAVDHLGDVSAGNEGLLAGTGQNQNLNIGICFDLCKAGIELGQCLGVECVQSLGTMSCYDRNTIFDLKQ